MYEKAVDYYNRHGDVSCSYSYVTADGCKLGQWLGSMRRRVKNNNLTQDRRDLLAKIGFVFDQECDHK